MRSAAMVVGCSLAYCNSLVLSSLQTSLIAHSHQAVRSNLIVYTRPALTLTRGVEGIA
jgi:hypothetical protein